MQRNLKLISIVFTVSFAGLFLFRAGQTHGQTKVETAGQRFKNIKVLNDMPADQLGKVMNIFSASLGVNCDFCHVGEDFEKDGKKEKETAREMIRMTLGINKDHFRGRSEVSCNTCHNGREHPVALPSLEPVASNDRPKQPTIKPTVDQIIGRYIESIGGAAKLKTVKSRHIRAQRLEPDGKTREPEEIWFKNGKYKAVTSYPNYVVEEAFDGTEARKLGNSSPIVLKADEAEQIRREADLFSPGDIESVYPKMEFRAVDRINGRDVNVINATTASGIRERLFFDVASGLLVRRTASTPTILGNFVYQVDYLDYKNLGGVRLPTTIRYAVPNIRWTRKIESVKTNIPVDENIFNIRPK
jgi:hypothetical protein